MTEIEKELTALRAELFAQGWLLTAILDTHPRRQDAAELFRVFAERHVAGALGSPGTEESIAAFEQSVKRWEPWLRHPGDTPG